MSDFDFESEYAALFGDAPTETTPAPAKEERESSGKEKSRGKPPPPPPPPPPPEDPPEEKLPQLKPFDTAKFRQLTQYQVDLDKSDEARLRRADQQALRAMQAGNIPGQGTGMNEAAVQAHLERQAAHDRYNKSVYDQAIHKAKALKAMPGTTPGEKVAAYQRLMGLAKRGVPVEARDLDPAYADKLDEIQEAFGRLLSADTGERQMEDAPFYAPWEVRTDLAKIPEAAHDVYRSSVGQSAMSLAPQPIPYLNPYVRSQQDKAMADVGRGMKQTIQSFGNLQVPE